MNRILKRRLPGLHRRMKALTASWRSAETPWVPVPKIIGGQLTLVHPRVFTSDMGMLTEPHIARWIDEHVAHGGVFFDVGANCGWLSLRAARRVGRTGRVVAFEPSPVLANILAYHVRANGLRQITTVPKAVADTDSATIPFFLLNGGFSFRNSLTIAGDDTPGVRPQEKMQILVPTVKLDTWCEQQHLWPTMVKIDVEGAELLVLAGGRETLRRRPILIVGVHPHWLPRGQTSEQIFELLSQHGYRLQESVIQKGPNCEVGDYLYTA